MQQTYFASFPDDEHAEIAVGGLLDSGVTAEDISAVIFWPMSADDTLHETKSGLTVAGSAETGVRSSSAGQKEDEGSFRYESRIGGGIQTTTPDDDVSSVEEMDDSSEVAEQMIYPANGKSYSFQEEHDMLEGGVTGFWETTKPQQSGLYGDRSKMVKDSEELAEDAGLESIVVPGLGLVLGSGALATNVLGAGVATERGGNPAASITDYLKDLGVPDDAAIKLANDFENGGAIVSFVVPVSEGNMDAVEEFLTHSGALNYQLVEV